MTVNEIFSKISARLIEGSMVHDQLMSSYLFLGLDGYAACHEYHYLSETKEYIDFQKFKMRHFSSLITPSFTSENLPTIIPESWKQYIREDMNASTRKQAIISAYDTWIDWEMETKKIYEDCFIELFDMKQIPASEYVKELILSVEEEIVYATNERLKKSAMDYDIVSILEEQEEYENSFKKKIRKG